MSQATAVRTAPRPVGRAGARPAPASRPAPAAPRLRVVSAPAHTRSRAGLVFGCIALLGGGLVALLLLNVSLERGSYVLQDEQTQQTRLQDQAQALREQLAALQSPENLAAQATKLGMVPNPNAAFLRASDGRVLGVPTRAVAPKPPTVTPAPGATAAVKPGTPTPATPKPGATATTKTTTGAGKPKPTPTH
jgi:hypothetical protein